MRHLGDIRNIDGWAVPPVDVITGGSPCQDLSVAGKRAGLAGEQSGLFLEQMRIVREMYAATGGACPRFMVWENVPGAMGSNGGKDFREVLNECVKVCEETAPYVPMPEKGGWPKAGCLYDEMGNWSIAWRVHDAQFWGVPKRRRRIALVCDFGGRRAGEILFEPKSERWSPAQDEKQGSRNSERADGCLALNGQNAQSGISVSSVAHTLKTTTREMVLYGLGNLQAHNMARMSKECAHTLSTMHEPNTVLCTDGRLRISGTSPTMCGDHNSRISDQCGLVYTPCVRRFTPTECERLQGYPDGWTDIPGATDQKRYKALGNSIALPFWRWLLHRIYGEARKYEPAPVMGSLFDGIGGFPLCWPGETVWSSEIDDFPLAVLRSRFGE